jgi:small neutral amino acid transporter SnatA (MarC family)
VAWNVFQLYVLNGGHYVFFLFQISMVSVSVTGTVTYILFGISFGLVSS